MKRAYEVLWITNYDQDIHADFFAIYHIMDWESLDGPLFIALAERLPMYEGAVQSRMRLESSTEGTDPVAVDNSSNNWAPGQTMTMTDALSGDAKLLAMQNESVAQGWGDIFEIQKG